MQYKTRIFILVIASTLFSCHMHDAKVYYSTDITYSTFIGGSGTDDCDAVTIDEVGNTFLGCHSSSDHLSVDTKHRFNNSGGMDAFIIKVNPDGSKIEFITHLGGDKWDGVQSIITAEDGSIYAIGTSYSSDFPVTPQAEQTRFGGKSDGFLLKLNKAGEVEWATFFGGYGDEDGRDLVLDHDGNIHIVGRTDSSDLTVTSDAKQPEIAGLTDVFVATYSSAGKLLYSSYFGGNNDDIGFGIAITTDNQVILTGRTKSPDFPITPAYYVQHSGEEDAFIMLLDERRNITFSTFVGGSGNDRGVAIDIDDNNNVYIVGHTDSSDLKTGEGALQPNLNGQSDTFLMKLNLDNREVEFLTYLGGSGHDRPRDMKIGPRGLINIVGQSDSTDFLSGSNIAKPILKYNNGFVAQISGSGDQIISSNIIGGRKADIFESVAVDSDGILTISGLSQSKDFQTINPIQSEFRGGRFDIVLIKMENL